MAASLAHSHETVLFENAACEPDRTRSLPNRDLDLSNEDFTLEAPFDFRGRSGFIKQCERFDQVSSRLLNRIALAGDVELRAKGNETIVLAFDDRGQAVRWLHDLSIQYARLTVALDGRP